MNRRLGRKTRNVSNWSGALVNTMSNAGSDYLACNKPFNVPPRLSPVFGGSNRRVALHRPINNRLRQRRIEVARCTFGDQDGRITSRTEVSLVLIPQLGRVVRKGSLIMNSGPPVVANPGRKELRISLSGLLLFSVSQNATSSAVTAIYVGPRKRRKSLARTGRLHSCDGLLDTAGALVSEIVER
jgi:hypothetical protein